MTGVGFHIRRSATSIFNFATRVILSLLLHFWQGIEGLKLGLAEKVSRPNIVFPFSSDCEYSAFQ